MMSLVATAFFLEAYLNHIGSQRIAAWESIERKLAPREKLSLIHEQLKLSPSFGRRPYQSFTFVFRLRDLLAHGRTATVTGTWSGGTEGASKFNKLFAEWQKHCTPKEARRRFEDGVAIVTELHTAAGLGRFPFAALERGLAHGSLRDR
jgi:hypothetical protein